MVREQPLLITASLPHGPGIHRDAGAFALGRFSRYPPPFPLPTCAVHYPAHGTTQAAALLRGGTNHGGDPGGRGAPTASKGSSLPHSA